jgi:mRNA interferase RelE/StbE
MASYRIEWKQSAQRELKKLGKGVIPRIWEAIQDLAENPYPRGGRKLTGTEHTYRIRVGDYRIVYSVRESTLVIEVVRVGHRKDIYRKLT